MSIARHRSSVLHCFARSWERGSLYWTASQEKLLNYMHEWIVEATCDGHLADINCVVKEDGEAISRSDASSRQQEAWEYVYHRFFWHNEKDSRRPSGARASDQATKGCWEGVKAWSRIPVLIAWSSQLESMKVSHWDIKGLNLIKPQSLSLIK